MNPLFGNTCVYNVKEKSGKIILKTLESLETPRVSLSTIANKDFLSRIVPIAFEGRVAADENRFRNENKVQVDSLGKSALSELEKVRVATHLALKTIGDTDQPLFMMDMDNVLTQFKRWKRCLPSIQPLYAVKCNPDPVLVAYLQSLGCDFDCATAAEMDLVVNQMHHPAGRVVFSNPCKLESHIRYARGLNVDLTIIDNKDEIIKVHQNHPTSKVLIRLSCSDSSARSPMSLKFGAPRDQVKPLLEFAAEIGLDVVGVHFHVGSGCSDPSSYATALLDARRAFDFGVELGHNMHVLDLGGGYPSLGLDGNCQTSNGVKFEEMALTINSLLVQLFPNESGQYRIIAEPGRFFAGGSVSLVNKVHSKSIVGEDLLGRKMIRYYMTEGLYGSLSCIIFDQQEGLLPHLLIDKKDAPMCVSTLFGPTCDGFDKIGDYTHLPELSVRDRIIYLSFGAYTCSITTSFNGFEKGVVFYYNREERHIELINK